MKLTLISMRYKGGLISRFVMLPATPDGKTVAPSALINVMNRELGCIQRGETFTVG